MAHTLRWSPPLASRSERRWLSLLVQRWSLSPANHRCRGDRRRRWGCLELASSATLAGAAQFIPAEIELGSRL
jgi:hypothetical protein